MEHVRRGAIGGGILAILYFLLALVTGDGFWTALLWTLIWGVGAVVMVTAIVYLISRARRLA
jgi:ABC-type sugar transport system permease subunit